MTERPTYGEPPPLPRDWLPEPQAPDGAPRWDSPVQRIMAAADPELRRLSGRPAEAGAPWWSMMERCWRPAAALAAAAIGLFLLTGRPSAAPEPPQEGSLALSMIVGRGDPVALWEAFGVPADPVLARIAVQRQGVPAAPGAPSTVPEEGNP